MLVLLHIFPIQLLHALLECIQVSLATGSVEALAELFNTPEKGALVNPKLKPLVGQVIQLPLRCFRVPQVLIYQINHLIYILSNKIISNKLELWKESAALNRVSLPHLVDFDWAVHIQKASSEVCEKLSFLYEPFMSRLSFCFFRGILCVAENQRSLIFLVFFCIIMFSRWQVCNGPALSLL